VKINDWLIIIFVLIILVGTILIYDEIFSAKKFCDSKEGDYKFNFGQPICNNQSIIKYSNGWDYERVDISKINIFIP